MCMILSRGRLGLAAMQEIPLYWSGMTKECKCVEKPWVYHGEWSPLGSPSGFGLGTSRGTPFTTKHLWLFHTLSQSAQKQPENTNIIGKMD